MPLVNGTPRVAGGRDRREPHGRALVGRPVMRPALARTSAPTSLSSIRPCETDTRPQRARCPSAVMHARVDMRQQAGLAQHHARTSREIVERDA